MISTRDFILESWGFPQRRDADVFFVTDEFSLEQKLFHRCPIIIRQIYATAVISFIIIDQDVLILKVLDTLSD